MPKQIMKPKYFDEDYFDNMIGNIKNMKEAGTIEGVKYHLDILKYRIISLETAIVLETATHNLGEISLHSKKH